MADPGSGETTLNPITPTTATVAQGTTSGTFFQTLSGFTSGSTRQIVDYGGSTGIELSIPGSQATSEQLTTSLQPLTVGTFNLVIRETLAGATNSPRDTTVDASETVGVDQMISLRVWDRRGWASELSFPRPGQSRPASQPEPKPVRGTVAPWMNRLSPSGSGARPSRARTSFGVRIAFWMDLA